MDSTRPLKACCGIWHQDVSSRSFKSCLVSGDVTLPNLGISVLQKPETIKWKGTSETITCHIKAHSQVKRIVVKWLQDNKTRIKTETFAMSDNRPSVSGDVLVNASLDLLNLNHSGKYYCTAQMDLDTLGPVEYGNGTHVYVGHSRIEPKAKEAVVDATHESPCPETQQSVVYAALNIPRDSVKSRNENSAALALTSVICTEDSVTYSEVHIKKGPKDEG
ncbi:hypothetical protein DPX16_16709 [Anabarilius grahami]|uniref:Ig-like domain-containing protein n=1 Tax=Anabarilius grahami TaxID=495550 RepID=A0A3N0YSE2_ANAGA|nr:hypothetical protein DPX16_16709 [Anabarilius grahami]